MRTSPRPGAAGIDMLTACAHASRMSRMVQIRNVPDTLHRKLKARAAVILGEDELARGAATIRDLDTGAQEEAPLPSIEERLSRFR